MTQVVEPAASGSQSASNLSNTTREMLTIAGYGLIVYGIYNIIIILLSGSGGADAVISRMSQLVALFPVLFLGPTLLYAAQPSARREASVRHILIRWLVLVSAVSYLVFIPLSFYTQYNIGRTTENVLLRMEASLVKRRSEILKAVADASSPEEFRRTLREFPEISNISISSTDTPDQVRQGIAAGINQGLRNQMQQSRNERTNRLNLLGALVRTAAFGSLVCGLAMMALAMKIILWLEPLGRSLALTAASIGQGFRRLFSKRSSAPRRRGPFHILQTAGQNLQRSMQRAGRRWAERRRIKASANKRSGRRR